MGKDISKQKRRKTIYIYKDFQRSFIIHFCLASFGAMVSVSLILLFMIIFAPQDGGGIYYPLLIWVNVIVMAALVALTFITALNASHRVGGPLYHFEKALAVLAEGDLTEMVVLREGDKLQGLADSINAMAGSLNDRVLRVKVLVADMKARARADGADGEALGALEELDRSLKSLFKT
jgi:methyl-accepting chemotaxis protein